MRTQNIEEERPFSRQLSRNRRICAAIGCRPIAEAYSARKTIDAFWPPKPRLLLSTVRTGTSRAWFGT